ncbi:MAG: hypothetical protein ACK5N8_04590 [Alphaproteobacteria bacterium]
MTSLFKHMGYKGVYKGREVLFLLSEADELLGIGFSKAHVSASVIKIRVSDIPELSLGDEIVAERTIYKVISEPLKKFNGLVWVVECSSN